MDVCYDSQTFIRQRAGGISRLFTDLVAQFDADPSLGVRAHLPFRWSNNAHVTTDLPHRRLRRTPAWLPREVLYAPHVVRGARVPAGCDVLHHTYYSGRFLRPAGSVLQVTTVYDMIPELFAGTPEATGTHLRKRDYVATCDLVVCISESTRQDMETVYGDIAHNVVTIPLSVGPGFGPGKEPVPGLPADYLLYVGKRAGYKDFSLLPAAVAALRDAGVDIPVVVVGAPFTADETALLDRWGVRTAFRTVAMGDDDLARAYANATVLVQTSRYEGFGLTPLEAMASGTAVVVARASSMPEVGGDVASYFAPGDADDLARVLAGVLADDAGRRAAGARGVERAREFTPHKMAERTAAAYRSLVMDGADR